jgi:hypothetical protein
MIEKIIPLKIISEANKSEHWSKKSARHRKQKYMISLFLKPMISKISLPCHVELTRIAPRMFDVVDNLPISLKWAIDAIAGLLLPNLAPGRADADERISWSLSQERRGIREYGLKVVIIDQEEIEMMGSDNRFLRSFAESTKKMLEGLE